MEDACEALLAKIGVPIICEYSNGIYMSAQLVMIAYTRSKDMMLEERPCKLIDKACKIPSVASRITPEDFRGGHETEDSDGEEILDIAKLPVRSLLPLVPSEEVTELQAKINVATENCALRRIWRERGCFYEQAYEWGGHFSDDGVFVSHTGPMDRPRA